MNREQILKAFGIDEQAYQATCAAIGLKNPVELTGPQIDSFGLVRGWLDSGDCKTSNEARERFKKEAKEKASALSGELDEILGLVEHAADQSMARAVQTLKTLDAETQKSLIAVYKRRLATNAPKYKELFDNLVNGQIVDVESNGFLKQTEPQTALPAS